MTVKTFLEENKEELYRIHKELCLIPAPSYAEEKRAEYCKEYLTSIGASGVYIDSAKNVIVPIGCEGSDRITVVNAHTDTVFPMETPLLFREENGKIFCPGVGDDTGSLAVMLLCVKWCVQTGVRVPGGLLFVANSGEEGLGNLYGFRQIYRDYAGRIARHIALDSNITAIADRCVGSHRYEVTVRTAGGHSFADFGRENAIAAAAKIIGEIYALEVPKKPGTKTTYNVGTVTGGTSVNTVAQNCTFLCEYRSDDARCLTQMEERFAGIFREAQSPDVTVQVKTVGVRPCAEGVDAREVERMASAYARVTERVTGVSPVRISSSTDCNIPLSLGIPAICVGVMLAGGAHTREEWLEKSSILRGTELFINYLETLAEEI